MKIESVPQEDHQIKLIVEIEPEQMTASKRRAARRIAERTKIPGFRPGKAPYDVIVRQVGEGTITEEAVEILVDEIYPEVLKQADIKPAGPGMLEEVNSLEPPRFTFIVPLEPVVELGDYRAIRLPYEWKTPGEEMVDEALEEIRRMHSTTETVQRPIQENDLVLVDLKGVEADGSDENAILVERPSYAVYVRPSEKPDEWPFPGFSHALVGMIPGESKSLTHSYASDFADVDLRGRNVKFDVAVRIVRGMTLPELNDEFAKTVGSFADLSALRDTVRANLAQRSRDDYDNDYFTRLIDLIKDGAVLKYPPQLVEREIAHVLDDLSQRLAAQGLDLETYLKSKQTDRETFIANEVKPVAIRRLERLLILDEVTRVEQIELNEEVFNTAFQQTWFDVQSSEAYQRSSRGRNTPSKQLMDAVAMESANRAVTQQTLARLKEIATGQLVTATTPAKAKKPGRRSTGKAGTSRIAAKKKVAAGETAKQTVTRRKSPSKRVVKKDTHTEE